MDNNFSAAMNTFLETIQKSSDAYMTAQFPNLPKPTYSVDVGKKYIRVVKTNDAYNRSVYCFVDKTNGNVLKAATWKAPAKHSRGNIYTPESYGVNEYGANYLRQVLIKTKLCDNINLRKRKQYVYHWLGS